MISPSRHNMRQKVWFRAFKWAIQANGGMGQEAALAAMNAVIGWENLFYPETSEEQGDDSSKPKVAA